MAWGFFHLLRLLCIGGCWWPPQPADPKPTCLLLPLLPLLLSVCGESGKEGGAEPHNHTQEWRAADFFLQRGWISWRTSPRRPSRWQTRRLVHTRMVRMGTLRRRGLSAPSALRASMCQLPFKAISRKGTVRKVTSTDLRARGDFIIIHESKSRKQEIYTCTHYEFCGNNPKIQ